ncbi:MAG: hypothetical protein LAN63_16415 [Acidobacteriia bacterium]|nr:hypothetical protein [Terriglobia bacterium]
MGFQQAAIRIEKKQEFEELKGAISRAFSSEKTQRFLERVQSHSLRVRDLDAVLMKGVLDQVDETLAKSGTTAKRLYQILAVSDQGQMREFYLSKIEEVDSALRAKFQKLYRYY